MANHTIIVKCANCVSIMAISAIRLNVQCLTYYQCPDGLVDVMPTYFSFNSIVFHPGLIDTVRYGEDAH